MPDVKLSQLLVQSPASAAAGAAIWTHKGHIDGLKLEWVSGTSIRVTTGSAYIQGLGYAIDVPAAITKAGLVLVAATWYHVYLFVTAGGAADIEIVTTAPATAYSGTARSKAADGSRRYLGSALTDSTGQLWWFKHSGNSVTFGWGDPGTPPQRPMVHGQATIATDVALKVPVTATKAVTRVQNTSNVGSRISNHDIPGTIGSSGTGTNFLYPVGPGEFAIGETAISADDQTCTYWLTAVPIGTAGVHIDLFGYIYER